MAAISITATYSRTVTPAIPKIPLNNRFMNLMAEWMLKTAPEGADVKSWRY